MTPPLPTTHTPTPTPTHQRCSGAGCRHTPTRPHAHTPTRPHAHTPTSTRDVQVQVAVAEVTVPHHTDGRAIRAAAGIGVATAGVVAAAALCGEGHLQAAPHVLHEAVHRRYGQADVVLEDGAWVEEAVQQRRYSGSGWVRGKGGMLWEACRHSPPDTPHTTHTPDPPTSVPQAFGDSLPQVPHLPDLAAVLRQRAVCRTGAETRGNMRVDCCLGTSAVQRLHSRSSRRRQAAPQQAAKTHPAPAPGPSGPRESAPSSGRRARRRSQTSPPAGSREPAGGRWGEDGDKG